MIHAGAFVALSHSGGKDSQAMTILLSHIVPRAWLVAVHVPLGEVKWPGMIEHIEERRPPAYRSSWCCFPRENRCYC